MGIKKEEEEKEENNTYFQVHIHANQPSFPCHGNS